MTILIAIATPAYAQNAEQQLMNQMAGAKGQKLQAALAVGVILGCTSKQAGRPATESFMGKLQAIGNQTSQLCKAGQKQQARDYVVANIDTVKSDPVLPVMQGCYQKNKANIEALAGSGKAAEFARYDSWAMNPDQAKAQLKPEEICH